MGSRSSSAWLQDLSQPGPAQRAALTELREFLLRAVYVYLRDRRPDLDAMTVQERRHMAEDFAQEALVAIQHNLASFRGDAKFTTWAYRFVINAAAGELRRRRYRGKLSLERLPEKEQNALMALVQPPGADPALAVEQRELVQQLLPLMRQELSERQRLAILGVHYEGRSMQEVAEALGTSTNTLYKMLFDARRRLKAALVARHLSGGDILAILEVW